MMMMSCSAIQQYCEQASRVLYETDAADDDVAAADADAVTTDARLTAAQLCRYIYLS